jgi:hypothetical protein
MRGFFVTFLLAAGVSVSGAANAACGCGPGCHRAPLGGCVVDGWGSSARVLNECPVGPRARPPCPYGYSWKFGACFMSN